MQNFTCKYERHGQPVKQHVIHLDGELLGAISPGTRLTDEHEISVFAMSGDTLSQSEIPALPVEYYDVLVQPDGEELDDRDPVIEIENIECGEKAQMIADYLSTVFTNSFQSDI